MSELANGSVTLLCWASILFWPPPTKAALRFLSILSLTERLLTEYQRQSRRWVVCGIAAATVPCFTGEKARKDTLSPFRNPLLPRATLKAAIIALRVLSTALTRHRKVGANREWGARFSQPIGKEEIFDKRKGRGKNQVSSTSSRPWKSMTGVYFVLSFALRKSPLARLCSLTVTLNVVKTTIT